MPSLGIGELLLVAIVLLVVIGPERLPHATRWLGRAYGQMRRAADELRRALVMEADRLDEEDRLRELRERRLQAEEERRRAEASVGAGATAQPHVLDEAARVVEEAARASEDETLDVPQGFTVEEWKELPPHIQRVIRQRGEEA
jgi:sec-independent protein translocase protein TatB